MARSENLPVLPQIVSQILKVADDPNAPARAMEKIIERDPAITAKVLRVANSAAYSNGHVTSIGRAISVLGVNTIRSLCLGVAYQQVIAGQTQSLRFSKLELWRHSLAVATCARVLARIKMPLRAEELYCAGMMHDVGIMVLDRFCPNELDKAIALAMDEAMDLPHALRQVFDYDQAEVGGVLAERWGMTPLIRGCVRYHLDPMPGEPSFQAACFINIANTLAHRCGFMNNSLGADVEFNPVSLEALGLPPEQLDVIQTVIVQEILKAQDAFQIK